MAQWPMALVTKHDSLEFEPLNPMELTGFCQCLLISTGSCGTHTLSLSTNPQAGILEGVWIWAPGVTWQWLQTVVVSILTVRWCEPCTVCICLSFPASWQVAMWPGVSATVTSLPWWAVTRTVSHNKPFLPEVSLVTVTGKKLREYGTIFCKNLLNFLTCLLKPRTIFIKNKYSLMFSYSKTNNKTQRKLSNSCLAWLFLFPETGSPISQASTELPG